MLQTAAVKLARRVAAPTGARALSTRVSGLNDVVIVSAARTPIGSIGGSLSSLTAPQLGSAAIRAALERAGLPNDADKDANKVEEVFFGNVVSAGIGQAPARQATLGAGLPLSVPCTTINKVCASGMKAIMMAAQAISTGHRDVMVAGGMESMSNIPYYLPGGRNGHRYGHGKVLDGIVHDGLWDVYNDQHMGMCAEKCAADYGISREAQDAYAIDSYKRAAAAWEAGLFADEVCAVSVPQRRGDALVVDRDEEFARINYDKVGKLAPAFKKGGSVTAANASSLNDGAAAMVLMSAARAAELGATPLARIVGFGDAAQAPEDFTTAPALALPLALADAGMAAGDVDYHEINEAFAVVALANMQLMGLDASRVNVNGGAVALGHPIGCSGARIVGTLLSVLKQKDARVGAASICNGGGGASSIIVERL